MLDTVGFFFFSVSGFEIYAWMLLEKYQRERPLWNTKSHPGNPQWRISCLLKPLCQVLLHGRGRVVVMGGAFPLPMLGTHSLPTEPPGKPSSRGFSQPRDQTQVTHIAGRFFTSWATNLESIWKNRDITLPTKVCIVKGMVFPVFMYRCESWTIKKAKCQRIVFKLWC